MSEGSEGHLSPHLFGRYTVDDYRSSIERATAVLAQRVRAARQPYSGASLAQLRALVNQVDLDAPLGSTDAALEEVARLYLDHAVWFHDPGYLAHLNCPVALPALTAEVLLAAVNSSVDTWDQSTTGTLIERRLIEWTAARLGFGSGADGVFTSGGTQSNLHGLLLAREDRLAADPDRDFALPRLRVLATGESHFSVGKAAGLLGLTNGAVVPVATDGSGQMDPQALAHELERLTAAGALPMAVVATAGTTDRGSLDPLVSIAEICRQRGVWLHVDAAYGCGLLVSRRHRHLIEGIESADSVTVDYHKSFFQPVSASAIVVRDAAAMRRVTTHADYLNPRTATVPNQVDKSLQTTRRFDALKLWMTLRAVGADQIGDMFDAVLHLAAQTYQRLCEDPEFEVAGPPTLSTVLFRYRPAWLDQTVCDRLQPALRARLFDSGTTIVAGTRLDGRYWLKFTLLNPSTTMEQVTMALDLIRQAGKETADQMVGGKKPSGQLMPPPLLPAEVLR